MTNDVMRIIEVGLYQWKLEKELNRWKLIGSTLSNGTLNDTR
jgi:hypothetical protein